MTIQPTTTARHAVNDTSYASATVERAQPGLVGYGFIAWETKAAAGIVEAPQQSIEHLKGFGRDLAVMQTWHPCAGRANGHSAIIRALALPSSGKGSPSPNTLSGRGRR